MKHFWATIKHKWFVFLASFKVELPLWRAIVHDMSKFTIAEFSYYNRQFFGDKNDPVGFAYAWLHHQNCNLHHWEYWITRRDRPRGGSKAIEGCLSMPDIYIREMIADWLGTNKANTGFWDMRNWLATNIPKMRLHPDTKDRVISLLYEYRLYETGCEKVFISNG